MNILFTKKNLDRKLIAKSLGDQFSYDFVEVIKTTPLKVEPFDLIDYSLIFTSVNGVDSFFENGFKPNEVFTNRRYNRIYTVGPKTKNALRKYGFGTYKVKRHAQELREFLVENAQGEKFLHFCGTLSLTILDSSLPLQNFSYRQIPVYQTELLHPKVEQEYQVLVFFSPSGVRSFVEHNSLENKKLFSIGLTTEKELRKYTQNKINTSMESNFEDLMKVLVRELSHTK
ncbi:uroporphyrinogen-III synthase [Chryseobacterium sp. A301]